MLGECRLFACAALASLLAACGEEAPAESTDPPPPPRCDPPNRWVGEACLAPGVQDDGCPAGTLGLADGTCRPAGIPPEACGTGFQPDGGGCVPILPARGCADGWMAVPGETACREVMPCGEGTWGDIEVDATTELVDGAYAGGDSDGSAAKPWTSIGDGVAAAKSGAIVAVAAGSYAETVVLGGRPVRLLGRCPSMVEVAAPPGEVAIAVIGGADGSEVRGFATRSYLGLVVSDAEDVIVDRVWVHDAGFTGIQVTDLMGPASAAISGSLVERASSVGILVAGADVTIDGTAVRDTRSGDDGKHGDGILVQIDPDSDTPASLSVRSSVLDRNRGAGIMSAAAKLTVDGCVVRDTQPQSGNLRYGRGINLIQADGVRTNAEIRRSFVAGNHQAGIYVIGSDVIVEDTVSGWNVPQASNQIGGHGVQAWDDQDVKDPSAITLRSLLLVGNHDAGALIGGSMAEIEGTLVRGTVPDGTMIYSGYGIQVGLDPDTLVPAGVSVKATRIEGAFDAGILLYGASGSISGTVVDSSVETAPSQGGDGVMVFAPPFVEIVSSVLSQNQRAGFAIFGGAGRVSATALECNAISLNADPLDGVRPALEDGGGNHCGCADETEQCRAASAGLSPPQPFESQ